MHDFHRHRRDRARANGVACPDTRTAIHCIRPNAVSSTDHIPAFAAVPRRAQGTAILRMMYRDPSIHIREMNARDSVAQFTVNIVADEVMAHVQPEIIVNVTRHRGGLKFCIGIGRDGQFHAAVDRR